MLAKKVRSIYCKGFFLQDEKEVPSSGYDKYIGGRQIGKRIPGPLLKSSLEISLINEDAVRSRQGARVGKYSSADAGGDGECARGGGVGRWSGAGRDGGGGGASGPVR